MFNVWAKKKTKQQQLSDIFRMYLFLYIYRYISCFHCAVLSVWSASWNGQRPIIWTRITSATQSACYCFFPRLSPSRLQRRQLLLAGSAYLFTPPSVKSMRPTRTRFPPSPLCAPVYCFTVVESTYESPENSCQSTFLTLPSLSALTCPAFTNVSAFQDNRTVVAAVLDPCVDHVMR